jgi:hypothetical protein
MNVEVAKFATSRGKRIMIDRVESFYTSKMELINGVDISGEMTKAIKEIDGDVIDVKIIETYNNGLCVLFIIKNKGE